MTIDLAADLAIVQRERFDRLWSTLSRRQRRIVEKALDDLERDLKKTKRGSWGAATRAQTMVQLAQAVRGMSSSQLRSVRAGLKNIARDAQASTADWLRVLDESFAGVVRPLNWDSLEWLEQTRSPLMRSRLKINQRSFARYGAAAVEAIEDQIAATVLTGDPWTKAREGVMDIVREQVRGKQWMVDRIVRTEAVTAHSWVTMAALEEENDDASDPMLKKLVATFDAATGSDSKLLHGQTRKLDEEFLDVTTGREYMAPPNRPNDREIVVGWRRSWGDDRAFDADTRNSAEGEDFEEAEAQLSASS